MTSDHGNSGSIGTVLSGLEFSDAERSRIATAAKASSLHASIVSRFAKETPAYVHFSKKEQIPGFRRGHPGYLRAAVRRIIDYLGTPHRQSQFKVAWDIYRQSAINFIISDLPALNTLLLEVDAPTGSDSETLLRTICTHAFEYDVSPDEVETFYEIWGIDRANDIKSILQLCNLQTAASVERKRILEIRRIERETQENLKSLSARFDSALANYELLRQQISKLEGPIERLLSEASDQKISLAELEQLKQATENLRNAQQQYARSMREEIDQIRIDTDRTAQDQRSVLEIASESNIGLSTSIKVLSAQHVENINELQQKLQALTLRQENLEKTTVSSVHPPLNTIPNFRPFYLRHSQRSEKCLSETLEHRFIGAWHRELSETFGVKTSLSWAAAAHRTIVSNKVICCPEAVIGSWIDVLGWAPFTIRMVASPVWSSDADWWSGGRHLIEKRPEEPRILVIHEYDVGITEAYLIPFILLWLSEDIADPICKLVLVPAEDPSGSSHRTFKYSAEIDPEARDRGPLQLDTSLPPRGKAPKPEVGAVAAGVFSGWSNEERKFPCLDEIQILEADFGVSRRLAQRIVKTATHVSTYLDFKSSLSWAIGTHAARWIEAKDGSAALERLRNDFNLK